MSWSRSDFDGIQWEIEAFLGSAAYEAIVLILFCHRRRSYRHQASAADVELEAVAELWGAGPTPPMLHTCGSSASAAAAYGESR